MQWPCFAVRKSQVTKRNVDDGETTANSISKHCSSILFGLSHVVSHTEMSVSGLKKNKTGFTLEGAKAKVKKKDIAFENKMSKQD